MRPPSMTDRPGREPQAGRQAGSAPDRLCVQRAPEGHTHWTLQLLADKVVELEFAERISLETVRQISKKRTSPGRRKSGVSPR